VKKPEFINDSYDGLQSISLHDTHVCNHLDAICFLFKLRTLLLTEITQRKLFLMISVFLWSPYGI